MELAIWSNFAAATELVEKNMSHRETGKWQGLPFCRGKLQGLDVLLINARAEWTRPLNLKDLRDEFGVERLVSLGWGLFGSTQLRQGDLLISSEAVGALGNYLAGQKLVDWALEAVERSQEDADNLRGLVGRVMEPSLQLQARPEEIFCLDQRGIILAEACAGVSLPFVLVRVIREGEPGEDFARESATRVFWVVKGLLTRLKEQV